MPDVPEEPEGFEQHAAGQFLFRPSGPDWDVMLLVVREMEERKGAGLPSKQMLADICTEPVIAAAGLARLDLVHPDVPHLLRVSLLGSWVEGFAYGVLFWRLKHQQPGPRRPAPRPDGDTIRMVTDYVVAQLQTRVKAEHAYAEVVDVMAMAYLAVQRVGLTFPKASLELVTTLTESWTEGFYFGALFERYGGTAQPL